MNLLPLPLRCSFADQQPVPERNTSGDAAAAVVHWQGRQDRRVAQRLTQLIPVSLGRDLTIQVGVVDEGYPQLGADESYRLDFAASGITLTAATTWGGLHAVTTLWQLCANGELPEQGEIEDVPRFPWRGVLIDVARHFMPMALLRKVVDGLARLKMNVLHLHLTDDQGFRLNSTHYPRLASDCSYSHDELRDLVAYAGDVGVRVVPELDVPGHVNWWLEKYPQWGLRDVQPSTKFGVHQACLNVTDDAVYDVLETLFMELAEVFPDDHIHIGGDEVHPAWWSSDESVQAYMADHGLGDVRALQTHFNRRLCAQLERLGKQVVAWDEVLHADMPKLTVQNWRGASTRDRALVQGQDCIVSAGYYLDLFYPADLHYRFDPAAPQQQLLAFEDGMREDIRLQHIALGLAWTDQWRSDAIDIETHRGFSPLDRGDVLGGEACLWSELVDAHTLEVRLWTRLPAVAERLWSAESVTDVDDFYRRLGWLLELEGFQTAALQRKKLQDLGLSEQQIDVAGFLEPVKWYARLLGEQALQARLQGSEMPKARPYDVTSALDRVVDVISPESLAARRLATAEKSHLVALCREWRDQQVQSWPADCQPVIAQLVQVATLLLEKLSEAPSKKDAVMSDAAMAGLAEQLSAAYVPQGEYMLAVVPWVLQWLQAWQHGER